ncbi:ATP-binding cassette domain-containing protein [Pseudarthrobacter sp. J75]|uniref:ABC transporter ATP-binding protein n=1 Tax=unclassified Pseudarthrobacter TaxID=2647000 RepID=UPI002E81AC0B|nr:MULTISPECIES: ATP-binding cassette domain-containing protein [unclassified Pseudarthrobacter]MEE2521258.1 ATP-binding cassette domain-containing protein [Pseudarthrobacter sp. J47]MEE2528490.1 ATP-binding cassette domain-containing protein [Pseudarthrobacter sp. J75]
MAEAMIEFHDVTKQYQGGQPAVDRLSMSISQGTITVFVGPSGCGKTTSLRMINRMVEPTSGSITVDGKDVLSVPPAQLRRSMGYVMQSSGLMPHRTVLDNIATVPRLNGVPRQAARKRAAELLDVVGLASTLGRRYPAQLSGGQQQRVGVARALAADPPVLLMDEPFSAVDPVVRDELQQELLRLQRDLAKTIVFVTHDIDEATILGDKVAVFAVGGVLAQYATPEEILRSPANDFVASFVGRDRGFRHLGFSPADAVAIHPADVVTVDGSQASPGHLFRGLQPSGTWRLVIDARRRPLGWVPPGASGMVAGGSLFSKGDSLRRALDAALSSPSGLGVAVDPDGALAGVVKAPEVLQAIESERQRREAAL